MIKKNRFIVFFVLIITLLQTCKTTYHNSITIAFYNVENLFDTIDNPNTNDNLFLPESKLNWNSKKIKQKIDHISRVLLSINIKQPPSIIGLCEIENLNILNDLILKSKLNKYDYHVIHKDSPDFRGIDVAMIYRPEDYKPLTNNWIEIKFPFNRISKTRDILYSKGLLSNNDTIHIFVNHWPSRSGGQKASEPKRIYLSKIIKEKTDSIFNKNPKANILIIGDFNDNPDNKSILNGLKAQNLMDTIRYNSLYNLSSSKYKRGEGTLFWETWNFFDQVIVSGNLLLNNKTKLQGNTHHIFKEEWILFTDHKGNQYPSRTASSDKYYGGFSDHLPVWLELKVNRR